MRFVLLEHDHPFRHWDLMLDAGTALRTWRLSAPPVDSSPLQITPLGDHRRAYLDYEGPVSGDRGTVKRWDVGEYTLGEDTGDAVGVDLEGEVTRGHLRMTKNADGIWEGTFYPFG